MSVRQYTLAVAILVFLESNIASALKFESPCPDVFQYESADQPNQWTGTLTLASNVDLHGVWVRLFFSDRIKELNIHDNFGTVVESENKTEYLVKNRDFLLKGGKPYYVKFTVKYDGAKAPTFAGFRVNARLVCSSSQINLEQLYPGDLNNKDFLSALTSYPSPVNKEFEGCGTTPLTANREAVNKKAQNGQWPWQGAIYIHNNDGEKYICGATLISSKHVLTPAHCVTYQSPESTVPVHQLTVYFGKYDQLKQDENTQKLGVEKIIVHPGYGPQRLSSDLAIVQLDKPAVINDYVRPICLPQNSNKVEGGLLVGYGIKENSLEELTQAEVSVLDENECLKKNPQLVGLLTDNTVCSSYSKDNGVCVGDSGSSLASLREGEKAIWELKGVVTVGVVLQDKYVCNPESRVFLVNISRYVKWIQSVVF